MADDEVWEAGNQAKKWFRVNKTSAIYKVAASYGQEGASQYRVSGMASASIPKPPQRKVWEVELYKLLGTDKSVPLPPPGATPPHGPAPRRRRRRILTLAVALPRADTRCWWSMIT